MPLQLIETQKQHMSNYIDVQLYMMITIAIPTRIVFFFSYAK